MTISDIYVDPSIDANSGDGLTEGTAYGDLQYAIDQTNITGGASGTHYHFHIKAGTDEVLTGQIDFTTSGNPDFDRRVVFRGYGTTIRDGTQAVIDCNSNPFLDSGTISDVSVVDLELKNSGANRFFRSSYYSLLYNVYMHGSTSNISQAVYLTNSSQMINCRLEDIAGVGIYLLTNCHAAGNYFKNGTNVFAYCIQMRATCSANANIMSLDGASTGIFVDAEKTYVQQNSILSSGGTGTGLEFSNVNDSRSISVAGNVIEGFSGAGGIGFATNLPFVRGPLAYGRNAAHNNTTDYDNAAALEGIADVNEDNEVLTASGFAKTGSDTFADRYAYFAPSDEGNMRTGGYVYPYKGAVPHAAGGGGSSTIIMGDGRRQRL